MAEPDFNLEEIARLIKLVESRGLRELVVEDEGRRLVIRGRGYSSTRTVRPDDAGPVPPLLSGLSEAEAIAAGPGVHLSEGGFASGDLIAIETPMVGIYYRSSGPDATPFVEVGDRVEVGQTIGLIEAMKVYSEIPAEHAGVVVEIVAQNGQLVRSGQPLMYLKPEQE